MERRQVLTACGTIVTGLLAGCSGGGGDATATATGTPEPTATATPEPTATATATPEPTATDTATPEPTATQPQFDGPTHGLDESFTVGTGNNAIGYRIIGFYRADQVGGSANNATADGTYLIVLLELSNPQDDITSFPQNQFLIANDQQLRYLDEDASPKISDDPRIDTKSLATSTVLSGNSKTGAVLFDVNPDRSYHIRIRPTGDSGETHYVPIGPISDVQQLRSSMT
ncbi:MAG: DUF4352 domain-containing protein [Haloplanus sp.]